MSLRRFVCVAVALLGVALGMAACGATSSTRAAGPAATASSLATATSPALPAACAGVAPGQVTVNGTTLPQWRGLAYPDGTVVLSTQAQAADGVAVSESAETLGLCAPNQTPDAIRAFYAARLPANGWAASATFPALMGDANAPCAAYSCWMMDAGSGSTVYLALDNPLVAGSATLFTIHHLTYTKNA